MTGMWLIAMLVAATIFIGVGCYLPCKEKSWSEHAGVVFLGAGVVCWMIALVVAMFYIGKQIAAHPI